MSLPNFFDSTIPSLWQRLLPGKLRRKQSVSPPVTTVILRTSGPKSDSPTREVYRSLSDFTTETNLISLNGSRKSGERMYRTSFTSTPHLSTNYYSKHSRRNFTQNPQLNNNNNNTNNNNGCANGIETEFTSSGDLTSKTKPEEKNTEKKKKRNIFMRLVSRKDKRTARSEQILSTLKDKVEPTPNLTQIKQPHLRSNILTSGAREGGRSSRYSGQHIGSPRRFLSDMNLYVPKSVKNLSTSAALEGQYIDESFSFLTDENIMRLSGSNHQIANGEFMLTHKTLSTGFMSEFSMPPASYSPQQNHYYDNNFHSLRMRESQNSGTSYETVENDTESSEFAAMQRRLNLRKADLSNPNLHVKGSFRSQTLMLKSSATRDVLY